MTGMSVHGLIIRFPDGREGNSGRWEMPDGVF
jgi:hypothetical protein